jgi:hypothetical protein
VPPGASLLGGPADLPGGAPDRPGGDDGPAAGGVPVGSVCMSSATVETDVTKELMTTVGTGDAIGRNVASR